MQPFSATDGPAETILGSSQLTLKADQPPGSEIRPSRVWAAGKTPFQGVLP